MMNKNELYQKAFKKWGDLQLIVAIEEMSELQKELCKALRGNHNLSEIVEEVADVEIMEMLEDAGITVAYFDVDNFEDYLEFSTVRFHIDILKLISWFYEFRIRVIRVFG